MNIDDQKSERRLDAKSEAIPSQKLTPTAFKAKHSEVSPMCDLAHLVSALEQNSDDDELRSVVFHHPPRATSTDWRLLDPVWQGPAVYSPARRTMWVDGELPSAQEVHRLLDSMECALSQRQGSRTFLRRSCSDTCLDVAVNNRRRCAGEKVDN